MQLLITVTVEIGVQILVGKKIIRLVKKQQSCMLYKKPQVLHVSSKPFAKQIYNSSYTKATLIVSNVIKIEKR